jgi:hypothetical protein
MKRFISHLFFIGTVMSLLLPGRLLAKETVNQLSSPDWYRYGLNPWTNDTDNDGYIDLWELKNNYCPTFPGLIALTDDRCRKGTFDLKKQVYTPPASVSFHTARPIRSLKSCQALENVIGLEISERQSLDGLYEPVAVYGADEVELVR